MEQWNFYLSGILYGIFERRDDRIFHRPLDVYTGMPGEWKELAEDDTWYLELGKMNVRKALMELEACWGKKCWDKKCWDKKCWDME